MHLSSSARRNSAPNLQRKATRILHWVSSYAQWSHTQMWSPSTNFARQCCAVIAEVSPRSRCIPLAHFLLSLFSIRFAGFAFPVSSPHRFQICPNCKTVWHRDINAGNNMFRNAMDALSGRPLHENFKRSTQKPEHVSAYRN